MRSPLVNIQQHMPVRTCAGAAAPGLNAKPVIEQSDDQIIMGAVDKKSKYTQPVGDIPFQHGNILHILQP